MLFATKVGGVAQPTTAEIETRTAKTTAVSCEVTTAAACALDKDKIMGPLLPQRWDLLQNVAPDEQRLATPDMVKADADTDGERV